MTSKLISFINGEHHRLPLAFTARNLEDEKRFPAIVPERVSAGPELPSISGSPIQRSACAPTANNRSISAPPRADPKSGSISARIAAATLWESDRSPAVCGVAGGAFVDANFAAGRLPRSLKGMFQWLALPTVTDHFPEGPPPVAG